MAKSAKAIAEYLSDHPFFAQLAARDIRLLATHAGERQVSEGDVLFKQGETAARFYVIETGRVTVEIPAIAGPSLQVQDLGPGEILGWSWLISPYEWDFQARVTEDTQFIEFDAEEIRALCDAHPRFGYAVLQAFTVLMSERLHAARRVMMQQWQPSGFA